MYLLYLLFVSESTCTFSTPTRVGSLTCMVVTGIKEARHASCGAAHTACVAGGERGTVYTWGSGSTGQLGHGNYADKNEPTSLEARGGFAH